MTTVDEAIRKLSAATGVPCRPASDSDIEWLTDRSFPSKVVDFYRRYEPASTLEYGPSIRPIIELEDRGSGDPLAAAAWKIGLFPFGDEMSGDVLCFDPSRESPAGWPRIVSVSHEVVFDDSSEDEIRSGVSDYCDDLPMLLNRMLDAV